MRLQTGLRNCLVRPATQAVDRGPLAGVVAGEDPDAAADGKDGLWATLLKESGKIAVKGSGRLGRQAGAHARAGAFRASPGDG